jgi:hypothetical protein
MTSRGDGPRVSLLLVFEPLAEQIASLRNAVSDLSTPHLADPDELSRLLLAAHELLENIVKYSSGGMAEFHFSLDCVGSQLRARLRTKNRAKPERLSDIRQRLDALGAASDPVAHYDVMIRERARSRDGSGLGLARILAESEMELGYRIEEGALILTAEVLVSDRMHS